MIQNARIIGTDANPADYFKQEHPRGHEKFIMSASGISAFLPCPARWLAGYEPPDSKAKAWGSLLDCLFFTPQFFKQRFAIQPKNYVATDGKTKKWSNNSTTCRAWCKEQTDAGRAIVKADGKHGVEAAQVAAARLMADPIIRSFREVSKVQVWVVAEWHDPETGLIIPLRACMDMVPAQESEYGDSLGDLKSAFTLLVRPFQRAVHARGYHRQGKLYLDMWNAATTGEERNTFCIVAQESYAPWQTARRMLSQDLLTVGANSYRHALGVYCKCLKTGKWPDYDDTDEAIQGWTVVRPDPYLAEAEMFGPQVEFGENDDEAPAEDPTDSDDFDGRH